MPDSLLPIARQWGGGPCSEDCMVEGFTAVSASARAYKSARRLRQELSLPEKLLWVRLRGSDIRFRRQHPIGQYVLDFYCAAAKLAIEVDGAVHDFGDRPRRDDARTEWLKSQGLDVVRIAAKHVLGDPDAVAEALIRLCAEPLHHSPSASGPPPHASGAGRSEG
jgi:very-short-patch-repair endonuclease